MLGWAGAALTHPRHMFWVRFLPARSLARQWHANVSIARWRWIQRLFLPAPFLALAVYDGAFEQISDIAIAVRSVPCLYMLGEVICHRAWQ